MRKLALLVSAATLANVLAVLFLFAQLGTATNSITQRGAAPRAEHYSLSSSRDASLSKGQLRTPISLP